MHRFGTLGGTQVAVARTQRQAIGSATGIHAADIDRQGKLVHHVANHHQLLVVFFAKHRHALRLTSKHSHEEFHHHGTYASEKPRAKLPFQDICQGGVGLHFEGLGLGVQLGFIGCEQHIAALFAQFGAVVFKGAGIAGKVFVWQKLQAVDKDAGHQHIAQGLGHLQQVQMAFVQIAHGGQKGGSFKALQMLAQLDQRSGDQHTVFTKRAIRSQGSVAL